MDAGDLQGEFRLGDWRVDPRDRRVSGPAGTSVLPTAQFQLLLCLVEHRGEEVDRRVLAESVWPGDPDADRKLTDAIAALQSLLGDVPNHPRHLVPVGEDGYALIAHVEPLDGVPAMPGATPRVAQPPSRESPTVFGRLQRLIAELQRRGVFKVAASYLVGMWIALQVAEVTFAPLHFPEWWVTALTILAVLGLPIVVSLAWTYEITPGGIVVDTGDTVAGMKLPRARRAVAPVIVAGVTAMAGVTGFAWWRSIQAPGPPAAIEVDPGVPSIAVLPLVDMSPGGGNGYLGDGLSEELSMRLAQVPGLRVASRTSAFEFKDRRIDVRKIGQSLGVRNVLEGSVRREGDSLRVTVQLIDARTGFHVWAGNFDRSWRDVLAMQDEVARSVTDALKVMLSPGASRRHARFDKLDGRALEPYLAGFAQLRQAGDMSDLRSAASQFAAALAVNPSFAPAHAGLCEVNVRVHARTRDPSDLEAAERECKQALELDASLVETERGLGALYVSAGQFATAEAIYRKLVERNPQDADGYIGLGRALEGSGQADGAEAALRRAVAVEPDYWGAHRALGGFLFARGRIADAAASYRKVTELRPASASGFNNLGAALEMQGDLAGAEAAFRSSLQLEPSHSAYSNLGTVHYYQRRFERAVEDFERAIALAERDQTLWGNLADAQWQLAQGRTKAVDNYRRAIGLAESDLAATRENGVTLAQLGHYCARVGDARAQRYLDAALQAEPASPFVAYYAAVAAATAGNKPEARRLAESATQKGYPRALIAADPSLRYVLSGN